MFHKCVLITQKCGGLTSWSSDSGADMEGVQASSTNHGNFCALLNFRISAGDIILRDNLQSTARNATYTPPPPPPDIQNQLISILGDQICNVKGGLHLKIPKFEHIFVAIITFLPFLLCRYF